MKCQILTKIKNAGLIAVIRGKSVTDAVMISQNAVSGGIKGIELTFTTPNALITLMQLKKQFSNDHSIIIGAGTVLDPITARLAILAGAEFIVSPSFSETVAKLCNLYGIPYFPGCFSPTEVVSALELGCQIVKLFPGGILTSKMISDLHGPIPHVEFIPSGGVEIDNIQEWLNKKAWALSVGSYLTKDVATKGYNSIIDNAKAFVERYQSLKK